MAQMIDSPKCDDEAAVRERVRAIVAELQLDVLASLEKFTEEESKKWHSIIKERVDSDVAPLTPKQKEMLLEGVFNEVLGFGPLSPLLRDPSVGDIFVNRYDAVYVERKGHLEKTEVTFDSKQHFRGT